MPNQQIHETMASVDDQNLLLSNRIGAAIMIGCLIITGALVLLLSAQTYSLNEQPQTIKAELVKVLEREQSGTPLSKDSSLLLLEHDAQFLRTKRAQSLVSARLFIQALSIMSGISLLIMGSAFVFARIKSPATIVDIRTNDVAKVQSDSQLRPNEPDLSPAAVRSSNGPGLHFSSHVPGLVLALFGTCIIIFTVDTSRRSKIETRDTPLFLPWPDGLVDVVLKRGKPTVNVMPGSVADTVDSILEENGIQIGEER